jgi:polyisoprenoid-binding protein YceI
MRRWLVVAVLIAQGPAVLPVGAFRIEPGDSQVEFVMRDTRGGFTGLTDRVDGTAIVRQVDGDSFAATVEARVDSRALVTGNRIRDGQMRRDFLHTDRFPYITFKGTATSQGPVTRPLMRALLRGGLTIRDVTREVEMPVEVTALADEYRARGEVVVRLSEYGIPLPRFLIFVAEDPVTIRFRVRLRRAG